MRFRIVSLFPELFAPFLTGSLLGRALADGLLECELVQMRDFSPDVRHRKVDDYRYGGGAGMLLRADVLLASLAALRRPGDRVLAMSPSGRVLDRELVCELAAEDSLLVYCGRYEGFDERFLTVGAVETVSIGDYVLMGGEVPAMVLMEAVSRRIEQVVGKTASVAEDSFEDGLLEGAEYTRPETVAALRVPAPLLSGNHREIGRFRRHSMLARTLAHRPDLLERVTLDGQDRQALTTIYKEWYCGDDRQESEKRRRTVQPARRDRRDR